MQAKCDDGAGVLWAGKTGLIECVVIEETGSVFVWNCSPELILTSINEIERDRWALLYGIIRFNQIRIMQVDMNTELETRTLIDFSKFILTAKRCANM